MNRTARAADVRERLVRLPGIDPSWSRLVQAVDADGVTRTWHLLDTHAVRDASDVHGVLLCVHGNPTWSYLWRRLLSSPPAGWRVIAVDQLGMGFSDHPRGSLAAPRTLEQRIADLGRLTDTLDLGPRVVVAGHDWGGMVASGWALAHRAQLAGLVLANTTVWHDFDAGLPLSLRFSLTPPSLRAGTVDTPAFVRGTTVISSPRPPRQVRDAYAVPYRTREERAFVGQFVADIPTRPTDPTRATMDALAAGLSALGAEPDPVPVLLLRGPKDPVFSEDHLRDLRRRLPHADVHRYEGASHLVLEDAPRTAADVAAWIATRVEGVVADTDPAAAPRPTGSDLAVGTSTRPWAGLTRMAGENPGALCVAEIREGRTTTSVTFGEHEEAVEHVALGLREAGVRPGDRVGLLVEPGVDLTTAVYACWRAGAVIVVADAGLGLAGMGRALRGAGTDHVVAMPTALAALPAMRIPGRRFLAGDLPAAARRALRVAASLDELRTRGRDLAAAGESMPEVLTGDSDAAVLYTSGATGPSKGVVYTVDQIRAQVGGFGHIYGLRPGDRLVAAFAPFALYGAALGVAGIAPDMKVTAPATLTAAALADAIRIAEATTVFASPAALRNVLRTGGDVTAEQREALGRVEVLMSAGAPVPASLLQALRETLMPRAQMHTPYGMTECLPVTDITLDELESLTDAPDEGVCVGRPIAGVSLAVAPLPTDVEGGDSALTTEPGVTGEICVRAAHMLDRYDQLWATTHASEAHPIGWHRTGDVGHLDADGRLWVEGRRVHVIHTPRGPVTPVGLEQKVEELPQVASAAVVGVGPQGVQQIVVVLTLEDDAPAETSESPAKETAESRAGLLGAVRSAVARVGATRARPQVLADDALAAAVRATTDLPVAAVLVRASMPVDIRHQSKIDRAELAEWAGDVLSGGIDR